MMPAQRTPREHPHPPSAPDPTLRLVLLFAVALIVTCTLAPFDFAASPVALLHRGADALRITFVAGMPRAAGHLFGFFLLGGLLAATYGHSLDRLGCNRISAAAGLFCIFLEALQLLAESRHARLIDFLYNFAGLTSGTIGCIRCGVLRAFRITMQRCLGRYSASIYLSLFLIASGAWLATGLRPAFDSLDLNWSPNYHLLIGNESDGSRPWLGEINYIAVYGRALTPGQVASAHASVEQEQEPRTFVQTGLLLGYDFARGDTDEIVPAGSLGSPDLVIEFPKPSAKYRTADGTLLEHPIVLASRKPASALADAIELSRAFSIEAWIRPKNATQHGPARIVSVSDGPYTRNFTLAQEADEVVFRVRNTINGTNGMNRALHAPGTLEPSLQHVVATYDHGVSKLFIDEKLVSQLDLREPTLFTSLGANPINRAFTALFLVLSVSLPLVMLAPLRRLDKMRHPVVLAVTIGIAVLPYALSVLLHGGPWEIELFIWLLVPILPLYVLCFLYVHHRRCYPSRQTSAVAPGLLDRSPIADR